MKGADRLYLLAEKLPVLDLSWPEELQIKWWRMFEELRTRVEWAHADNRSDMQNRIDVAGEPVSLDLKETSTGFRLEILPLTDAPPAVKETLFERANEWARSLNNARGGNAGVHCYREAGAVAVESLLDRATAAELDYLVTHLQRPLTQRAAVQQQEPPGRERTSSETPEPVSTG